MPTSIVPERPDTADAKALVAELEAQLAPLYPRESRHSYSVEKLIAEAVAFFIIRHDGAAAGCGGIKLFGAEHGEIKRMYVPREAYRVRGGRRYGQDAAHGGLGGPQAERCSQLMEIRSLRLG